MKQRSAALQLISTRMLSGAGRALVLIITAATAAPKDVVDNLSPPREVLDYPRSAPQRRPATQLHSTLSHLIKLGDVKKTKTKPTQDNNTGLRKSNIHHSNSLPANVLRERPGASGNGGSSKILQDRNRVSPHPHHKGVYEIPDYETNRPGKMTPKSIEAPQNSSKAARITNRHPAGRLQHFSLFRKEPDGDRTCPTECPRGRDEREAYCHSDFAVNGIVYDVDVIGRGIRLLTVLVNSAGLYKMNRLYVTPDGDFFRVRILAADNPLCHTRCLHLVLGGRYIIMGQIYHRRMELPAGIQRAISNRVRAGDGLLTSGGSFIRRFNRKTDRRVLGAAHSKCK